MTDNIMIPKMSWEQYSRNLPLVAFTGLVGEDMTIYACLQQAIKIFDYVIVFGDNPTPEALNMLDKFLSDHKSASNKVQYIDQTNVDPWPWISFKKVSADWKDHMFGQGEKETERIFDRSWSKAATKKYNVARAMFPNAMLFSLHSDVILFNDSRERFYERIVNIDNPLFDSEWFSMVTMLDSKRIIAITSPDSGPGNLKPHPDLAQRKVYDYPGDWGLMCLYSSSCLTIGPDPNSPIAECLWPWSAKTQCQKKGHDTNVPYGIHLEFWRSSRSGVDFSAHAWKWIEIESIQDADFELYNKFKSLKLKEDLYFPKRFELDSQHRSVIL